MKPTGRFCALACALAALSLAPQALGQRADRAARPPGEPTPPEAPAPRPDTAPRPPVRATFELIPLAHVSASETTELLNQAFRGRELTISADERTNAILLSAEPELFKAISGVIAKLDVDTSAAKETWKLQAVALHSAVAGEVAKNLQRLAPRRAAPLQIVADERANVVWLAGAPAEVASYAATAQQMDQMTVADGGDADAPGLRFFALEHARAKPLADTINRMLSAMGIDAPVVADVQSNKLVVFASAGPHEQITTLITNLDVPGKGGPE